MQLQLQTHKTHVYWLEREREMPLLSVANTLNIQSSGMPMHSAFMSMRSNGIANRVAISIDKNLKWNKGKAQAVAAFFFFVKICDILKLHRNLNGLGEGRE